MLPTKAETTLWTETLKCVGGINDLRYLLPTNQNIAYFKLLARFGLGIKRLEYVDPAQLEVAYHLKGDFKRMKGLPLEADDDYTLLSAFMDRFPPSDNVDKRVPNTWMYDFLVEFGRDPNGFDGFASSYYKFLKSIEETGVSRTADFYQKRFQAFFNLLFSMKAHGYIYDSLLRFVSVLEVPLITTRHGFKPYNRGYEIYTGHHRACAAAFLGLPHIRVAVLYDRLAFYGPNGGGTEPSHEL